MTLLHECISCIGDGDTVGVWERGLMGKVVFKGFKVFVLRVAEIGKNGRKRSNRGLNTSSCCCLTLTFGNSDQE